MTDERYVRSEDVHHGPRRTLLDDIDRELEAEIVAMDLYLDEGHHQAAWAAASRVKEVRARRQAVLDMPGYDLPREEN